MQKNKFNIIISLILAFFAIILSYDKKELDTYYLIIYMLIYIFLAKDIFKNAFLDFKQKAFMRENFLMAIASLGSLMLSEFSEAIAIIIFYKIGQYYENKAVAHSKNTVTSLLSLKSDKANLIHKDEIKEVKAQDVKPDELILIKAFEKVPLDCLLLDEEAFLDTKALSGEAVPKRFLKQDELLAGMINQDKAIKARVIRTYENSSINKILDLIQNSQRARLEKIISKFAKFYTPAVVFLAVLISLIPTAIYGFDVFKTYFEKSLILLVISCPCAFVIGVPLTYFAALGRASKMGIVVKGGVFLDELTRATKIIFDKTGTLSKGEFKLQKMINRSDKSDEEVLYYAYLAELNSSNPLAKVFLANKNFKQRDDIKHQEIRGKGVVASLNDTKIIMGSARFLQEKQISLPKDVIDTFNIHLAVNNAYLASFLVDDKIKDEAKACIQALKEMGLKTQILSGDKKDRVEAVAKELEIDDFKAQCLPQDKLKFIENDIKNKEKIIFVGDGINDSLALIKANVGIAMGKMGSDISVENSDIVIMNDNLLKLVDLMKLAKFSKKILLQNLSLALGVKFLTIILASITFIPMYLAILADTGVTVIVVLNALRLLYKNKKEEQESANALQIHDSSCCCNH
ncbi:heavy metal translocating P-type ATPase [Campylobacter avium]|uniref:heavy metal translocating P-type ATPase n=1 Tax=Campylobacter avium TaxID=522485 RepID=UPI00255B9EA7|nr:heavy metal translocating P-type ATPase [Campylobacter avium]